MAPDELLTKWKRRFGLRNWTILRLPRADRPQPAKTTAFSEADFPTRTAKIWADSEPEIIHELLHVLTSDLDDAFWRTNARKGLRSLFNRREERLVSRLERALTEALKE